MTESVGSGRSTFAWLVVALVIVLAAGGFVWMNREIQALQAAIPPVRQSGDEQVRRAVASLQQASEGLRSGQQKLADQLADVERKLASEGGERKLLSDQLGSLSARVDALASANADSTAAASPSQNAPASPKPGRGRR